MKKIFILVLLFCTAMFASPSFPTLSSQVVDEVGLLNISEKNIIISKLQEHENNTSNQIVLVILKSLNSYEIADYSYQLGRHWGIGQKDKNNGVLLVFAMEERKIRIEVGYGLEGILTDAISHDIIEYKITPQFKQKNFSKGIKQGIDSIILTLDGKYEESTSDTNTTKSNSNSEDEYFIIFLIVYMILLSIIRHRLKNYVNGENKIKFYSSFIASLLVSIGIFITTTSILLSFIAFLILAFVGFFINLSNLLSSSGSSSSGSSSSVSFSGGGGSFGGGGASGGW